MFAFPELPSFPVYFTRRWKRNPHPFITQCDFLPVLFGLLIHIHVEMRESRQVVVQFMIILVPFNMFTVDHDGKLLKYRPCCHNQMEIRLLRVWYVAWLENPEGMGVIAREQDGAGRDLIKVAQSVNK